MIPGLMIDPPAVALVMGQFQNCYSLHRVVRRPPENIDVGGCFSTLLGTPHTLMASILKYLAFKHWAQAAAIAASLSGSFALMPTAAQAFQFDQRPIDQDRIIAIAAPVGDGERFRLMILEQITNQRQCWQERSGSPTVVEPLLLNFDFSGICGRSADSNGYSLRVGDTDLGMAYRLQMVQRSDHLALVALPSRGSSSQQIEIGRTDGLTNDFTKIQLNQGWKMTRRVYEGQPLGHIYLSHDGPLDTLVAGGSAQSVPPASATRPSPPLLSRPSAPPTALPPTPTPVPPAPIASSRPGVAYRVIVPVSGPDTLNRVRAVESAAFRTLVGGQSVIQAGVFQEVARAQQLLQRLSQAGLSPQLVETGALAVAPSPGPQGPPPSQGRLVVTIDPGHGGRDPGAIGIGGLQEKGVVLEISRRVQQRLEANGIMVVMTRTGDQTVDLAPRVQAAERSRSNLFVSIHANAISMSRPEVNGLETFFHSGASSQALARSIQSSILQRVNIRDRGVKQANFYVLRNTSMPAVLVEVGFLTGREDIVLLRDANTRMQIADAIADGIISYARGR